MSATRQRADELTRDSYLRLWLPARKPAADPVKLAPSGRAPQPGPARTGRAGVGASAAAAVARRRSSTRSSRWSTSSFSSRNSCSPGRGRSSRGSRKAALATASASIGSDLPRARPARRSGAISLGGTRTSSSPAASSSRSSARVSCRQSSSAHNRSPPKRDAHADKLLVRASDGLLVEHPASLVDSDSRQRLLVHVHSDHDHSHRLLQRWGRPASGQTSIEAAATLLSGHARRSRDGGGDTTLASQPKDDMREWSQPPPTRVCKAHRTPPPAEDDIEFGNVTRCCSRSAAKTASAGV